MSSLHFLVPVLQVSNSFDLNSLFFHVLFSLIFTVYGGYVRLLLAEFLCSTNLLFKVECRFSFFCSTLPRICFLNFLKYLIAYTVIRPTWLHSERFTLSNNQISQIKRRKNCTKTWSFFCDYQTKFIKGLFVYFW